MISRIQCPPCPLPLIESTPVEALRTHGIVCGAFTINDQAVQKACHQKGFRAIFSDTLAQTP
jgi:glycerophosphoryl diester phosphodiesterase